MNRDGSGVRRMTNHPEIDVTPTWSPTGNQIAFTSDRTGTPQIYIMNADGTGMRADHAANRIATARPGRPRRSTRSPTRRRSGGGYDIKIYDFANSGHRGRSPTASAATRARRSRPTAGTSRSRRRRAGKEQIFTIARDGNGPAADHARGRQQVSELVAVATRARGTSTAARPQSDDECRETDDCSDRVGDRAGAGASARAPRRSRRSRGRCLRRPTGTATTSAAAGAADAGARADAGAARAVAADTLAGEPRHR